MKVCEKINAFEQHVLDRQLRIAQILGRHFTLNMHEDPLSQSAFAITSIGFSYFEMIEQFATGQSSHGQSESFFKRGFARVFPNSHVVSDYAGPLYSMMRCGLYHSAMPTDRCGFTRELQQAISNDNGVILINPTLLIEELISHFIAFCGNLRDGCDADLIRNFENIWDSITAKAKTTSFPKANTTPAPWDQ